MGDFRPVDTAGGAVGWVATLETQSVLDLESLKLASTEWATGSGLVSLELWGLVSGSMVGMLRGVRSNEGKSLISSLLGMDLSERDLLLPRGDSEEGESLAEEFPPKKRLMRSPM